MNYSREDIDLSKINGATVTKISAMRERTSPDGTILFDEILIDCGDLCLRVSVDVNSDEIVISDQISPDLRMRFEPAAALSFCVEKELGWSWIARNSNGYNDCIMFSFSVLSPEICLVAEASALTLYYLAKVRCKS